MCSCYTAEYWWLIPIIIGFFGLLKMFDWASAAHRKRKMRKFREQHPERFQSRD
jgi:hypothetical protein